MATDALPVDDWRHGTNPMTPQSQEQFRRARQKGVRRTVWITGAIALAVFVLSILQMLKG